MVSTRFPPLLTKKLKAGRCGTANNVAHAIINSHLNLNFPISRFSVKEVMWPVKNLSALIHTIEKCKKMAGQNTLQILLFNDANMIGKH